MAEALVSLVVEQLGSMLEQEVRLVVSVEKEVKKLKSNLIAIKAVLTDAETEQVQVKGGEEVREWLWKLKDVAYDIGDVMEDWNVEILSSQTKPENKVCPFRSSCFCCERVCLRHDIASKIKELNESLDRIAKEKEYYHLAPKEGNPTIERPLTTSMIDIREVKGREEDKSALINMLLSNGNRPDLHVVSIVGMGGIGKTTLAQFVYNDVRIKAYFDKKVWVCVSDPFDEKRVAETVLESLKGSMPAVKHLQGLLENIEESIKGRKFLLVLDNVWESSRKWEQLKQSLRFSSPGSRVLVTTRNENVAWAMGCSKDDILKVGSLSDEECWLLVSKIAFSGRSNTECHYLEEIGKKISNKCRGLPLAAKEEAQREVFVPLWLSYYDLSPPLKRCFSYCAIFPKDYEIKRIELIELWMAQGYLDSEVTGENYFQNLATRSFFQDFKKVAKSQFFKTWQASEFDLLIQKPTYELEISGEYDDRRIYSCKMHDIMHDFAQIVARNECHGVQGNGGVESVIGSVSKKARHVGLTLSNHTPSSHAFKGLTKMRSLLFVKSESRLSLTKEGLSRLFSELTHGRSLSLRCGDFSEVPSSISKLVHLRWLDLSYNLHLKKLPETLCQLHSLQTIDVTECPHLQLPRGIGELINLKHLHNYSRHVHPSRLPKGIAELTGLITLDIIYVGCDKDAFSLGDLKNLNQLRGRLIIRNLGACNLHLHEAKQAELKKKEHITDLRLRFYSIEDKEEDQEEEEQLSTRGNEELLEALEPSRNLENLSILFYGGTTFPDWMISLTNLRCALLYKCRKCKNLPSLGKLPFLETLTLSEMYQVKKVGFGFLGTENQIGESKSVSSSLTSSSSSQVVAFPKLTKLIFDWITSWEEWVDYNDGSTKPAIIMPCLHSLRISYCFRLKALPNYILQNEKLHTLYIKESYRLRDRYSKEKGEDWSKISHISDVIIYG